MIQKTPDEILEKALQSLRERLSNTGNRWAPRVAMRMLAKEGFDEVKLKKVQTGEITDKKLLVLITSKTNRVRNIIAGVVRSKDAKIEFINAAGEVASEIEDEQKEAADFATQFIQTNEQ